MCLKLIEVLPIMEILVMSCVTVVSSSRITRCVHLFVCRVEQLTKDNVALKERLARSDELASSVSDSNSSVTLMLEY